MNRTTAIIVSFIICISLFLPQIGKCVGNHDNNEDNENTPIIYEILIIAIVFFFIIFPFYLSRFRGFPARKTQYGGLTLYKEMSIYRKNDREWYLDSSLSNKKNHCVFKAEYYDFIKSEITEFKCQEEMFKDGLCIFHYGPITRENSMNTILNERINKLIEGRREVFCIGYNIHYLSLKGKIIYKPIYFHDAKIKIADFSGVNFATEEAIAYFVNTHFEEATFENTRFHGKAVFVKTSFLREGNYQGFFYRWKDRDLKYNQYTGFVDFNNTKFYGKGIFYKAGFYGHVQFDNAYFYDDADFRNTRFIVNEYDLAWKNVIIEGRYYNNGVNISTANYRTDE